MTKRRGYSDRFKARALQLAAEIGPEKAARKLNLNSGLIYNWKIRAKANKHAALPMVRPKIVTATAFACPHCGGPVVLPK